MSTAARGSGWTALAGLAAVTASSLAGTIVLQLAVFREWEFRGIFIAVFVTGFVIALSHIVVLGVTLYLLLIDQRPLRWGNAAIAGTVIGAVPIALLTLIQTNIATHFWEATVPVLFGAGCGLVGGLVFRAVRGRDLRDVS